MVSLGRQIPDDQKINRIPNEDGRQGVDEIGYGLRHGLYGWRTGAV